ncbi:MAG: substrate-binding domain-containing protein [Oscillospiraceae bacterium]|jgi:ABC-type phosphate transport system substrate-binding protein|nr:substrate-binding domain-containing protein [Oscillospiraceae bacterium]
MQKKRFAILLALLLVAGCTSPSVSPDTTEDVSPSPPPEETLSSPEPTPSLFLEPSSIPFQFTEENFPRIDGSTANIPLGQMVYSALLGKSAEEAEAFINFNGTATAWRYLMYEEADLLLVYEPSEDTTQWFGSEGFRSLEFAPIGRDALVFLVNIQNKVNGLTTEQIQGIYSDEITNWKEVGGDDAAIAAYQRNTTSGSQAMMLKLVMQGLVMAVPPQAVVIGGMGGLVEAVAAYDNAHSAIGYNVYYYVSQMKNDPNIKLLPVNGVEPDNGSIQSGAYPFVNDFFVAIRTKEPAGSPARILYNWLQSADGQALVEAAGYVPVG